MHAGGTGDPPTLRDAIHYSCTQPTIYRFLNGPELCSLRPILVWEILLVPYLTIMIFWTDATKPCSYAGCKRDFSLGSDMYAALDGNSRACECVPDGDGNDVPSGIHVLG